MRPRSGGSAEALWISQLIIQWYKVENKYLAIMYGYLDSWLFCTLKNLLDRLASLAFSGAVFNNCTIVLGSQPLAPQVTTAIYSCEVSSPCDLVG